MIIIKLIFFVGEVISKTPASCFIRVSNTRKQQKHEAAFISFLVFETPMKHSHSFLKYYVKMSVSGGKQKDFAIL